VASASPPISRRSEFENLISQFAISSWAGALIAPSLSTPSERDLQSRSRTRCVTKAAARLSCSRGPFAQNVPRVLVVCRCARFRELGPSFANWYQDEWIEFTKPGTGVSFASVGKTGDFRSRAARIVAASVLTGRRNPHAWWRLIRHQFRDHLDPCDGPRSPPRVQASDA
jgi:hypothetical protein